MNRSGHRKSSPRKWNRPRHLTAIFVGLTVGVVGTFLERQGVSWKYSEIGGGTVLLVWFLLSAFRPEWRKRRFWFVVGIVVVHLTGWVYLTTRIERFGFPLMFILVIVEIALGASAILKAIPEDYQVMVDYISRR
jgi:hypothetical protein